jgi:hypothetical protein
MACRIRRRNSRQMYVKNIGLLNQSQRFSGGADPPYRERTSRPDAAPRREYPDGAS